jgi:hypothetical protein
MDTQAAQIGAQVAQSPLGALYPEANWETSFRKMGELQSRDYDWLPQVGAIQARAMLVFADADGSRSITSRRSTRRWAAASATRGWTVHCAPPPGWPSYRGRRITTC